jgi:hypothetical protein
MLKLNGFQFLQATAVHLAPAEMINEIPMVSPYVLVKSPLLLLNKDKQYVGKLDSKSKWI